MARTHAVASVAALSALDSLDAPVRDDVRRHGVDPRTDVAAAPGSRTPPYAVASSR